MKHTSKIHRFSVWAPQRKKISLKLDDRDFLMEGPSEHGWWSTEVEHAAHGSDYSFLVDDIDYSYPDPRSLWQPNGVHAVSDSNAADCPSSWFAQAPGKALYDQSRGEIQRAASPQALAVGY